MYDVATSRDARSARPFVSRWITPFVALIVGLCGLANSIRAQNIVSVPFTDGFIGTRGSSAGTANNVLTYATLGIARTFFIQSSSTTTFELQGNDIPGTLRIVRTNGVTIDMPASANWRNSGGSTYLIGILPRPVSPITYTYSGGSIQITDGSNNGGSSVGGYIAGYSGSTQADGSSTNGNAAQSQVLSGLNSYLSTVVSSRPSGPVTVNALSTSNTTPTITGTATLVAGENLSVVVSGQQYTTSTSPALVVNGTNWSLALSSALAPGTYDITATITDANGFTLSDGTTNELTISAPGPTTLTIGGSFTANNKVYDGLTSASGSTGSLSLVGVNSPDQVTIASVTLAFQTSTVGNSKTVTIAGVTLGGADAANYTVSLAGAPTATANITARPLTIGGSFTANNKTYDGSTSATIATNSLTLSNVVGSDDVSLTSVVAAFATATVGTGKTVSISSASLSGTAAGNYSLSVVGAPTATANITTAGGTVTITGSFTASDKVYDGLTAASGNTAGLTLSGVNSPDQVTIASVTLAFQTATVANTKTVVITAVTLGGADAGSYSVSLVGAPTATASVTAKGLTISGVSAVSKVYDGTTAATLSGSPSYVGLVNSESFTVTGSASGAFANATVANGKSVTVSGYTAPSANYSVAQPAGLTANITARPLTISGSFTASNKPFDGTTAASIATNSLVLSNVVGSDDVSLTSVVAAFSTAAVGNGKTVSITSASLTGAAADNYSLSIAGAPTATANITTAGGTVTIGGSFTANNKVYDGLTAATGNTTGLTLSGVTSPDQVTIASVTIAFQTAVVGNAKTVVITAVTLGGSDAGAYAVNLAGAPTATANITAKSITITGVSANNKVYDATTAATLSGNAAYSGLVNSETFTVAGTPVATFANANVGNGKTVTVSGYSAPSVNYALAVNVTLSANITARALTIGGTFTANDKFYDSTTFATMGSNGLTLAGVVAPDEIQLTGLAIAFADASIGNNKMVSLTSYSVSGSAAGNYTLSGTTLPTARANILPASPPSAPRNVVATPGNGRVVVTWTAPSDEGCRAITLYRVGYSVDNGETWTTQSVAAVTPLTVTLSPVVNNRPYLVRVAAVNPCGASSYTMIAQAVVPVGPVTGGDGNLIPAPPGTGNTSTPNGTRPVTVEVVQDTIVRMNGGDFSLTLQASDTAGAPIPVDSTRTLSLEQGGRGFANGRGFLPGTYVTLYLYMVGAQPILVGQVRVASDGSFSSSFAIPSTLPVGNYTLQVDGLDLTGAPRSVSLGVEVNEQPADLVLTAVPSQQSPAVGDTVTITLTVTNIGRGSANDVVIPRAFREPGFLVVKATPVDGTYNSVTFEWKIPRIAPGARAKLLLTAVVVPPSVLEPINP